VQESLDRISTRHNIMEGGMSFGTRWRFFGNISKTFLAPAWHIFLHQTLFLPSAALFFRGLVAKQTLIWLHRIKTCTYIFSYPFSFQKTYSLSPLSYRLYHCYLSAYLISKKN
jgi:hypothetical protein